MTSGAATTPGSPRVGIALSGGAVRGAAHIGVLEVLEEHGIRPQLAAGTSVGALVGAAYASGRSAETIEAVLEGLDWFSLARPTLNLRLGLLSTRPLEAFLRDRLGLTTFEALARPFQAVTCDLSSGEEVVLGSGDLPTAVQASAAIPGVFSPVRRDGRLLVDGGIVDNLPLEVVRAMGADVVIGVDLLPPGTAGRPPRNLFEVWQRSLNTLIRSNHPGAEAADCLIVPDVAAFSFTEFEQAQELLRRGREAAERALPALEAALRG